MIGFGILGGNSVVAVNAVNPAIDAAPSALLVSICSRSGMVDVRWRADSVPSYDAVLADPAVDVVYIALPNGLHREWTEKALIAGKHVLCEKPLAGNPTDARAMVEAAERSGLVLAEAWMTPFAPRWQEALHLARSGIVGTIERIESAFTFTIGAGNEENYRWDREMGGGALLDVGIYVLGAAVELWGPEPASIRADRRMSGGVDIATDAELRWSDGQTLGMKASFDDDEAQTLRFIGTGGTIELRDQAHTMDPAHDEIWIDTGDGFSLRRVTGVDPYVAMVEALSVAVRDDTEFARSPRASLAMVELLDRIADASPSEPSRP